MSRWKEELRVLFEERRKQLAILGALFLLLGVLGARAMLELSPRSAAASGDTPQEEPTGRNLRDTHVPTDLIRELPTVRIPAPPPLERDLFAFDRGYFPLPAEPESEEELRVTPKSDAQSDEEDGGSSETADAEEARVREAAERLTVQSLMLGSNPLAVIEVEGDGEHARVVVGLGDEVGGFTVTSIQRDSIVLWREGHEVGLDWMKHE